MVDQFDSNVARRKPNTAEKLRPVLPWDIASAQPPSIADESLIDDTKDLSSVLPGSNTPSPESVEGKVVESPADTDVDKGNRQHSAVQSSSDVTHDSVHRSDLSDSINIHSNYCKLDNDISDRLMQRLSASAQSVYLRLYRQSYGWNRNWAAESLPKLTEFCNLSLQTVRKAIKELESSGCIKKEFSDYHRATVYRVFLPSEINIGIFNMSNNSNVINGRLIINSPPSAESSVSSQNSDDMARSGQDIDRNDTRTGSYHFLEGKVPFSGGRKKCHTIRIFPRLNYLQHSEAGGALPKNISKYITDTHITSAVSTIDEFYDSIGFSVVSRSLYRKSLIDYFEMIKSGFSPDDIRYAVRWTFKNSRTRPESFSLIKHTMHLAMDDLIRELKTVSGSAELAREKQEAVKNTRDWTDDAPSKTVSPEDMKTWLEVRALLGETLNEHSFSVFIDPLRLESVEGNKVLIGAPPDSVSWVLDHYLDHIRDSYREKTGREVVVEIH